MAGFNKTVRNATSVVFDDVQFAFSRMNNYPQI